MKNKKNTPWWLRPAVFSMTCLGFDHEAATQWVSGVHNSFFRSQYRFAQTYAAVKCGFLPSQLEALGLSAENCGDLISPKDYSYLQPLNGTYSKWIHDMVSIHTIFKPFRPVMPVCFYQIGKRDGQPQIISLSELTSGDTPDDILALLKQRGHLKVRTADNCASYSIFHQNDRYYIGSEEVTDTRLLETLFSSDETLVITENIAVEPAFEGSRIRIILFNEHGDDSSIGDAYIRFDSQFASPFDKPDLAATNLEDDQGIVCRIDPCTGKLSVEGFCRDIPARNPVTGNLIPGSIPRWQQILETADAICCFAPQLEFFGLEIVITTDSFRIMRIMNHPDYPRRIPFSKKTTAFLKKKLSEKKSAHTGKAIVNNFIYAAKKEILAFLGYLFLPRPLQSVSWIRDQVKDFIRNKETSLKEKIWSFRHGFLSYRLKQYGITPENWENFISDFEYGWLRHINGEYRVWLEDKITVKYVCSKYNHCFPEYYYHIILKNGKNKVLPMMDCPEGYCGNYEDIFRLVQEKGALALKPDEGSHGDGFYKFSYADGAYFLNHKPVARDAVLSILQNRNNQYLITEYITMHPEIKRLYPGAVNTIRMIVFKKDGKQPQIGNAYMRIGSVRTGAVDNMGAGGMYARIDVDTGWFGDGKILTQNQIIPCAYHPDTNEKIEGYLPNWEYVKQQVLSIAKEIPQLEYFGFDVAITPDGLKFPEINRSPDYPAIEQFSTATIDYLLYRLDIKKRHLGYDTSKGHTLFKLPTRSNT